MRSLILTCCIVILPTIAQAGDDPIYVGGSDTAPACAAVGEVIGLDPHGDGFLSVRTGPGGRGYSEIDRVFNGERLNVCDQEGNWLAVVYDHHGSDCDVHRPRLIRQPYTGPCQSGWVSRRYVEIVTHKTPNTEADQPSDTSECENLWRARNSIFKSAGYCFTTARAIAVFGNAGCQYDSVGDVPLSENQRRQVAEIASQEKSFACGQ